MTSVLFMLGSIILIYLLVKRLFGREDMALTSAALLAFNPLAVFFGRQFQMINPALFFSLLGVFLYLLWLERRTWPWA